MTSTLDLKAVLIAFLAITLSACPFSAFAEDKKENYDPVEIVVTASRSEQPRNQVASSINVIDAEEIASHQDTSVIDALKSDPTLDVVSTGTVGASTSVSIRGANPEHTLVLLDGIELNNPILPGRSFNFADLMLNEVERIEILRGPQSTLYGSDAMGGIINIISKKGEGPLSLNSSLEAGSDSTFTEQASVSAGEEQYNYAFSILREDVTGISAADSRYGNSEGDGYDNTTYFTRLGVSPTKGTDLTTIFRAIDSNSEIDNAGGAFADDPNRNQENTQYFWGTALVSKFLDDKLKSKLSYTFSDQSFKDDNDPDISSVEYLRSKYQGKNSAVHGQLDYTLNDQISFIAGAETEEETGQSDYTSDGIFGPFNSTFPEISATTNGYYLQSNLAFLDQLFINSGIRVDDHSKFGTETTWRVGPSWSIHASGTRLFSTVGSGFKAPSLFQLYSSYGSLDLKPERSLGVDAGIEQEIVEDFLTGTVTYFHQSYDDLIDFDPNTFIFSNIKSATTNGMETSFSASLCEWSEVNLGYTYLDATNEDTGAALLRRARNKFSAYWKVMPTDDLDLAIQTNYRSSSYDNDFSTFPATTEVLAGYTTVASRLNYSPECKIYSIKIILRYLVMEPMV